MDLTIEINTENQQKYNLTNTWYSKSIGLEKNTRIWCLIIQNPNTTYQVSMKTSHIRFSVSISVEENMGLYKCQLKNIKIERRKCYNKYNLFSSLLRY